MADTRRKKQILDLNNTDDEKQFIKIMDYLKALRVYANSSNNGLEFKIANCSTVDLKQLNKLANKEIDTKKSDKLFRQLVDMVDNIYLLQDSKEISMCKKSDFILDKNLNLLNFSIDEDLKKYFQ